MRASLKPLVINLTIVGVVILLCFVVAEIALRLFPGLMPEEAQLRIHWRGMQQLEAVTRPHPYIGFLYPPNHKSEMRRGPTFGFSYETDAQGFRNGAPWPDQADIVVAGDSMAFGYGVSGEQGWVNLLAEAVAPDRVINLGMIGAAPQQYERIYETFGVALKPKVVIFALFPGNDLYDAEMFDRWLQAGSPGNFDVWRLLGGREPGPGGLGEPSIKRLLEASYLVAIVRQARRAADSAFTSLTVELDDGSKIRLAPSLYTDDADRANPTHPVFGIVMESIERSRALAAANGSGFLVLLVPTKEEVYLPVLGKAAPDIVQPFVKAFGARGIAYLDLTPPLQEQAMAGKAVYFEVDGHPNAAGYRTIAEAVLDYLKDNGKRIGFREFP